MPCHARSGRHYESLATVDVLRQTCFAKSHQVTGLPNHVLIMAADFTARLTCPELVACRGEASARSSAAPALSTSESFRAKFRLDSHAARSSCRARSPPRYAGKCHPRRYAFPLVLLVRQPRHHLMSRSRSPLLAASAAPRNLRCRARSASTRSVGVSRSILNSWSTQQRRKTGAPGRRVVRSACSAPARLAWR